MGVFWDVNKSKVFPSKNKTPIFDKIGAPDFLTYLSSISINTLKRTYPYPINIKAKIYLFARSHDFTLLFMKR
ncbi:CLUMA_CG019312, isoform A [Clunio marinus]|uniref:CLUMA_CG019312, isoform A n=1 Tax=Clunio marinus TaxID=568069 RepID=A0A1J1J1T2_9DIPT|nr:CLUMA_CG019312, isoform A [Clunio marinus]